MADSMPDDRDLLAAEHALGLLDGAERAEAMRRVLAEPAFAAEVQAWRARLDPLCAAYAEAPPPELWNAIERRVGAVADPDRTVVAGIDPPVRKLRAWRFGAIGSGLVAASLAAVLVFRPVAQPVEVVRPPAQVVVAQLDGRESGAFLAANYDPAAGALRVRAIQMPQSELAPELWIIPSDGVPRSLGYVSATGISDIVVAVPHRKLMQEGATLAITMEPRAATPHAVPSAAPVAAGRISTI